MAPPDEYRRSEDHPITLGMSSRPAHARREAESPPVIVTLDDEHIAYCDELALKRQESADRHDRRGGNGGATMGPEALDMNIKGARGECAAYLWFRPIKWHTYREGSLDDLPDLGDFIDVKTVVHRTPLLIIQPNAPDDWAYILVNGLNHPHYRLEGWMWGYEAKVEKYKWDPLGGRPAYFVPARDLHHPDSLGDLSCI